MLVPAPPFPRLEWIKDERVVYLGSTWPNGPQSHGYPNSRWIQKSGSRPSQSHPRLLSKRSQPITFSFCRPIFRGNGHVPTVVPVSGNSSPSRQKFTDESPSSKISKIGIVSRSLDRCSTLLDRD